MHNFQKTSTYFLRLFNVLLILLPIWRVIPWILVGWAPFNESLGEGFFLDLLTPSEIMTPEGRVNMATAPITALSQAVGAVGSLMGLLPLFLGLLVLRSLFRNYQKGKIFILQNAQHYRQLGWLFFLDALFFQPISEMLVILAATLSNPPGHRFISLSFGTPNLESVFCGLLLIVISWVMVEGYRLQEDQKFVI